MSKCALHINNKYQKIMAENKEILSEIMDDINKMHKNANTPEGFNKTLKKYLKEIHEDKIKAEADDVLNLLKNESNYGRVMDMRSKGVPVSEAVRSLLTPSTYNVDNAGLSISSVTQKQTIKYTNMIEQGTTHAEKKILAKGSLDEEIIFNMAGGKAEGVLNPTVEKMSGIFRKIYDMTHADKKNVGIMLNKIENYVFNQSMLQNTDKMRSIGKADWVAMQLKDLDHEKSFPYLKTDTEKVEYLEKVYDGALERQDESIVTDWKTLKEKDILKSSVQSKYSKPRTLHYSPEGLVNQFKTFSDKPLVEIMLSEIAKSARDTAMYDILGPRGTQAVDTIVQKASREIQSQMNAATDPDVKAKLEAELDSLQAAKSTFLKDINQITNANNRVKNKNVKAAFDAGRTFVNSLILGNVPLAAVTDLAWGVTAQQINTNRGYLAATGNLIKSIIDNMPTERRSNIVTKMRIAQESMLGHMLRVEGADSFLTKFSSKLNYAYSTVLPVQWQTRLHKTWSANIIGVDVAEMAGKKWSDLNELEVQGLRKAGINGPDLPALAAMADDLGPEYSNTKMVSSENILNISDEMALDIIAQHKARDPKFIPKTPSEYRAYIEKRYDAYIEDYSTTAVPMPGERARSFLHGNGEAGDAAHETRKTLTMLKSFMVHQYALMQKVYRASPNKGDKARHLSGVTVGLISMAYGRDVLESLLTGDDLPDPTDIKTVKKAVLRSGAGTILADILLQDTYGGRENALTSAVAGPLVGKADQAIGLTKKAFKGDFTSKDAKQLTKFIPGNNLMYFKLLNHHILDDAHAAFE